MITETDKNILFINEAKDFFDKYKLEYEYRENKKGECSFISKDTIMLLYYNSSLDLSVNIEFEKDIQIKIEHLNEIPTHVKYDMQDFRCKLYMILEYIDTHKKLKSIENHLHSTKIHPKWKSKNVLDRFSFVGQMEESEDDE